MSESNYMSVNDARDYLGVSRAKIARMLTDGTLPAVTNPLDKRGKLILRSDVEKLKTGMPPTAIERKNVA